MPEPPDVQVIDMAHPAAIARYAGRTVLIASAIPMALFYLALSMSGLATAVAVTVGWYYAGLLVQVARRRPVLGSALLGAALMTVRAITALWLHSAFVFFLQPVAATVVTALSFLVTALAGRPLLERLARDYVPIPAPLAGRLHERRFFTHTSLLWSLMYAANALGTVWVLTTSSLSAFLLIKTVLSPVLTGATILLSYLLFRRLLRRDGVRLRWRSAPGCG